MPKSVEAIDAQIEKLKEQKKQALREQRERAERSVARAADRSGLLDLGLSAKELEGEFRAIARRKRTGSAAESGAPKPASPATKDADPVPSSASEPSPDGSADSAGRDGKSGLFRR